MNNTDRPDAWNLLFVTKVNVCYWKKLIELYEKRCRWAQYCVFGMGALASIIVYSAKSDGVTTWITAGVGSAIAVISGPLLKLWSTGEGKRGHERWSQLRSDVDVLWRHGELRGWDDPNITSRAAQLVEREKQYQANEYHNPNPLLREECEELIRSQMPSAYRTEER